MSDNRKSVDRVPTAEEVKDIVRRYVEGNYPDWANAGVVVRVGGSVDAVEELLVIPTRRPRLASTSP